MAVHGVDWGAPLPLGYSAAVERAAVLRRECTRSMSWGAIALVMREYHGFDRSPWWWAKEPRGRVPVKVCGRPFAAGDESRGAA